MSMTLSKRGDYVTRAAISPAKDFEEGAYRKIREVVAETEVPQTFASQILADLVRAGLATSRAGRDGGYRLERTPGEISVLEVIEVAEGPPPPRLVRRVTCSRGALMRRAWAAASRRSSRWSRSTPSEARFVWRGPGINRPTPTLCWALPSWSGGHTEPCERSFAALPARSSKPREPGAKRGLAARRPGRSSQRDVPGESRASGGPAPGHLGRRLSGRVDR